VKVKLVVDGELKFEHPDFYNFSNINENNATKYDLELY
jgi:hypothetical protein